MKIASGAVVSFHYTLTNDAGDVLDSSEGGNPLSYLHGHAGIIPGLEQQLEGKEAGAEFDAVIPPEDAYGVSDPQLIQQIPLEDLAQIENLEVGMRLQSQGADGRVRELVVDAIDETSATLNANHMLADETLHFAVKVAHVREATEEELAHGHAH